MKSLNLALLFGFLIWLVVFAVAMLIYPLRVANRAFFESIMPVTLTVCVIACAVLYFRRVDDRFLREGVLTGAIWLLVSVMLDLLMFMWGSLQMSFADYVMDIGSTYLLMPTITIGSGYLLDHQRQTKSHVTGQL